MARMVVVDPDPRIRGALVRLLASAGHVADEFDRVEEALGALAGAELVFAAAGPGGSAIDPTVAAFSDASVPGIVWTGPVAAMIRPAVDAGVGVDCLELPTRLPALNSLVARHLSRSTGDKWSGEGFLRRVRGKGDRFPPIRVLFLAHRLSVSGHLRAGAIHITLQQGSIAEAKGIATVGSGGGLMHAIGMAIGQGQTPDQAMREAGVEVMRALVKMKSDDQDVSFEVDTVRAPVVLPTPIPRLLSLALADVRPGATVKRLLAGSPSRRVRLKAPEDSPETAWGLSPVALRVVRAASRAQNLGDLVAAAGGADKDSVWEAVDYLLHLGIVQFGDAMVRGSTEQEEVDGVFTDIVIEAVETKPVDSRVARLLKKAEELEQTPPWTLFDITDPADANPDFVDERFRSMSLEFHPDRFTSESSELADAAAACFAALGDARDRFDNEAFRDEVRARLIAEREGKAYVSDADRKNARMAYTRGEHAARRKDWTAALEYLNESQKLDPTSWETAFQLALTRWKSGATTAEEAAKELFGVTPTSGAGRAEVRYQLGEALLAAGQERKAYIAFGEAVEANPDHVGAQRRLRMKARRSDTPPAAEDAKKSGGLRGMFGWGRKKS